MKFARDAGPIHVHGSINCQASEFRTAFFTGKDDSSVGVVLSTNPPSGYYGDAALELDSAPTNTCLGNLRISYFHTGLRSYSTWWTIKHSRFCNVENAFTLYDGAVYVQNALLYKLSGPGFYGFGTANAEHLTVHDANSIVSSAIGTVALNLTNSLLVWITNWPTAFNGSWNATNSNDSTFVTAGSGAHWLAADTYRGIGTNVLLLRPARRTAAEKHTRAARLLQRYARPPRIPSFSQGRRAIPIRAQRSAGMGPQLITLFINCKLRIVWQTSPLARSLRLPPSMGSAFFLD